MKKELTQEQHDEIATLNNSDLGDELYIAYLDEMGASDFSDFDESYNGSFKDDQDFAQDMAESLGAVDFKNQAWPQYCIDWEYAARELMMDYTEINGHYFRNL